MGTRNTSLRRDNLFILVGTQVDLRDNFFEIQRLQRNRQRPVTCDMGIKMANKIGANCYVECSALTQIGLKAVFDNAILAVIDPKPLPSRKRRRNSKWESFCHIV